MASRTAYSTWTSQKPTLFDGHYLRNRSTLDIDVLGYIGIVQHKEHSPEVLSIPPGTLCISVECVIYTPYQNPAVSTPQRLSNRVSTVGTVTRLQAAREIRDISLLRNVQTGSGVHPASHSICTGVIFHA